MTAEYEHRSTVNKRYEPPSVGTHARFTELASRYFNEDRAKAAAMLRYLNSLDEHMVRALMYHARNGGLP